MIEVKVQCPCGTRFAFDVEPVNGQMPMAVACPSCQADGTAAANEIIRQKLAASGSPSSAPPTPRVRLTAHTAPATSPAAASSAPVAVAAPADAAAPTAVSIAASAPRAYPSQQPKPLLERTMFLVKERVALLKLTDAYDILDPTTGETIGIAREEPPGWAKFLRLVVNGQMLPTSVNIYEAEGQPPALSIHRGFTIFRSKIRVVGRGQELGYFRSKLLSIGGGFFVYDNRDQQVAEVKGNWKGWDFKFLNSSGREIGTVTKKWAGLGKELFTSADNYIIAITDTSSTNPGVASLMLAAGLAIDIVFKEGQ